ncbi:MAG TPA: hypothetical protein VG435_08530 [Acidimicrobiales bacterium]|nr:hypothetical protein [Acidimicrobiales bacterium]
MVDSSSLWFGRWADGDAMGLAAFLSPEFPDGAMIELDSLAPRLRDGADEGWRVRWDRRNERLLSLCVKGEAHHRWFVFLDGPSLAMLAFESDDVASGRVLDRDQFKESGLDRSAQIGQVVWKPASSQLVDVQVEEAQRRRGLGRVLLCAAAAHQVCSGHRLLWAGGARTDLGDMVAQRFPYSERVNPRAIGLAPDPPPDILV